MIQYCLIHTHIAKFNSINSGWQVFYNPATLSLSRRPLFSPHCSLCLTNRGHNLEDV